MHHIQVTTIGSLSCMIYYFLVLFDLFDSISMMLNRTFFVTNLFIQTGELTIEFGLELLSEH